MSKDDDDDSKLKRKKYDKELRKLQGELCLLQEWVKHKGLRAIIVFEGRDAAGKGGTIKASPSASARACSAWWRSRPPPTARNRRCTCSGTCSTSRPRERS